MARLYRICPETYLENYSGVGSSFQYGARWNRPREPVLYFACSAAVAMLEMAQYLPLPKFIPLAYRLGIYELDDALLEALDDALLPADWAAYPYPASTQQLGSQWLAACRGVGLILPSAAIPGGLEKIALVNARHSGSLRLRLLDSISSIYNARIFTAGTQTHE